MKNKTQNIEKQPFLRRRWWGIICTIIFIVGSFTQCGPEKVPSSMFGGAVFLGKIKEGAVFIVLNTNDKFRIVVSGGDQFIYDANIVQKGADQKYHFTVIDNAVKIFGLTPQLSKNEMNELWSPSVGVVKNENGTLAVGLAYEYDPMTLSGYYTINDNTVSDHYFKFGTPIRGFIFTSGVIGLYLLGAIIKGIIRFLRWRKQRIETQQSGR
ncbi:MAG: hypothetical protein GY705_01805 [Bacteroidetes bacterium]|nr:hypothetical protein [Bacteroidota bacterium]